ncbi:MAG: hypothetical protein Unbinned2706contig1001_30 [Prokaryotic dsDNA virus sp.]|nr:MAG: hypothetical protein Unbinned2706contig1001_30 [Prokaryotic dsDNA virus sp.]|tara:strand:+ start:5340 stop:5702 length:363 start_codon:yes stop_codon:yes gene_type:complete
MPTYCYEKPDGSIVELVMTISEMEKFDKEPVVDGETYKRRIDVEMSGFNMANDVWRAGLVSESAACHPSNIPEYRAMAEKKGVPTNYDKWGRPSFTSRGHRAKYLKAFGLNDRNGGYGDG